MAALTLGAPCAAVLALVAAWGRDIPVAVEVLLVVLLMGSVAAAVHHAEVVAHRVGEPFGSLVLAVAVTVIEVGLIVTLMVSQPGEAASLARDTVFAAVMITCNGIAGAALLVQALRRRTALFNAEGTNAALATVLTLATLCLVLPRFTTSTPGPVFSSVQLTFAAVASLALYALFVFVQNIRHRDYFLPPPDRGHGMRDLDAATSNLSGAALLGQARTHQDADDETDAEPHAQPPSTQAAVTSAGVLLLALVGVVGLAKVESKTIEHAVSGAGLPESFVGVVIALLVLLPETIAAVRNANRGRVQISLNLALGSAMASIGLTIPTIAAAMIWLQGPLLLGLGGTQMVLLALTVVVGTLTIVPGRANVLQGGVHLSLLAVFLFLAASP
jgi:Ca2+:H+ antiporter